MSAINQHTLTDSRANDRPPMLEKGDYILWEMDVCKNAKEMWERIKRLMHGSEVTNYLGHLRLMDEFDKFTTKEGESLESVYEILTTLVNIMDLVDYEEDYQGELHRDSQEDKLITVMILLARPITQKFSTPTNNCLCTSSNIRNQAVIQDGRFDIQIKNAGYGGNGNRNAGRQNRNQAFNAENVNDETMKDEAGSNLNAKENDFMLDNSYEDETLEELTAATLKELQQELIEKVHEMLNIFKSMKQKFAGKSLNENIFQNEIDRILIVSLTGEIRDYVLIYVEEQKNKLLTTEIEKILSVKSSNSVGRPKSKDTKSKNRVLKNINVKSSYAHVRKVLSSVSIYSNKYDTINSIVCQSNISVLNTKTVNVVNDGSNIVCVSCGKDVFMLSHEKCVTRYALSRNSRVKRALFTTPATAKSKNLGATSVVAKSRLSVAKTPTATNKVSSALSPSPDSSRSRTLRNYMKNKITPTTRKLQKWLEYQQCFN
nr:hypothetical protein [Tanacetum cinerariifolium]